MYSKKDLKYFKELIEKEKAELLEELGYMRENSRTSTTKEATGDHSSYSFHMADQGTDSQEREKAFLFASRESQYLEKLDQALTRIKNSTYGICVKCEDNIDKERLEAVPIATMCIDCKTNTKK
ncbi:MAG: TraR/DksA family transcriptional regulator [bacterium]|nr:TraR/DksA family transcriptional regulator [bacterium]